MPLKRSSYIVIYSLFVWCSLCFMQKLHAYARKEKFPPVCEDCAKAKGTELTDLESIKTVLFSKCLLDENLIVTRSESCQRNCSLLHVPSATSPHTFYTDPNTCQGFSTYCSAVRADKKLILYVQRIIFSYQVLLHLPNCR